MDVIKRASFKVIPRFIRDFGPQRIMTHVALALVAAAGCYVATLYAPHAEANYVFTLGFGYVSLLLMVVTLVIGPLKMFWQKRNPVNIDLRRDVGIWAAITGCLHVWYGLKLHQGGRVIYYFLGYNGRRGYFLLTNRFGMSNMIGAAATLILIALLVTSNNWSMRKLKGKRWKTLQRLNYVLFGLAATHTFLYQAISRREQYFTDGTIVLVLITLGAQAVGMFLYGGHQRRRLHQHSRLAG